MKLMSVKEATIFSNVAIDKLPLLQQIASYFYPHKWPLGNPVGSKEKAKARQNKET